jgi:FixJ family two-component response regulator
MTPVILITGRSDRLLEAKARLEASVAILDKPVAQARLFAAIDTALAGRL